VLAIVLGAVGGWAAPVSGDIGFLWRAARAFLEGRNPYRGAEALLYPLPAVIAAVPLAMLPERVATTVFVAVSAAVLAFVLGPNRFPALFSVPFWLAVRTANWPMLALAGALWPGAGWLWVVKPNLGLVMLGYQVRRQDLWIGAALIALSFALSPTWPVDWLDALGRQPTPHLPMLFWPLGFIGLVGLLRWRTPEGRVLVALTLVPVSALPYDLLLLHLCTRNARESWILTGAGWATFLVLLGTAPHNLVRPFTVGHLLISLGVLLPAAIVVWRRR
jgi:hypothetical protein